MCVGPVLELIWRLRFCALGYEAIGWVIRWNFFLFHINSAAVRHSWCIIACWTLLLAIVRVVRAIAHLTSSLNIDKHASRRSLSAVAGLLKSIHRKWKVMLQITALIFSASSQSEWILSTLISDMSRIGLITRSRRVLSNIAELSRNNFSQIESLRDTEQEKEIVGCYWWKQVASKKFYSTATEHVLISEILKTSFNNANIWNRTQ